MKAYKMIATSIITFSLVLASSPDATAAEGWYLGGAFGKAFVDETIVGNQLKADSSAYRFYGGYAFNHNFGVEFSYINFGTFRDTVNLGGVSVPVSAKADGFSFAAVGTLPLGERFSATARFGFYFHDGQSTTAGITANDPSDQNPFVGLGLSYDLTEALEMNVGVDYFDIKNAQPLLATIGLTFRF